MKKVLFIAVLSIVCLSLNAQKQFNLEATGFVSVVDSSKNYVVVDVPNTPQNKLYQRAKMYLNTLYNNPKFVTAEVENEQIAIDAIDSKEMKIIFVMSGPNIWTFSYKYVFSFKDNKIKFAPVFKNLVNSYNGSTIDLIGSSILGTVTGLYNKKGKCLKEKAKIEVENSVNDFVKSLSENMNKQQSNDNW